MVEWQWVICEMCIPGSPESGQHLEPDWLPQLGGSYITLCVQFFLLLTSICGLQFNVHCKGTLARQQEQSLLSEQLGVLFYSTKKWVLIDVGRQAILIWNSVPHVQQYNSPGKKTCEKWYQFRRSFLLYSVHSIKMKLLWIDHQSLDFAVVAHSEWNSEARYKGIAS